MSRQSDEVVFEKDRFRCVYSEFDGRTFEGWQFLVVDHFKPRSKGGTDDLENLVTACVVCNSMKGASEWPTIEEAARAIEVWRDQMREHWEKNVRPLVLRLRA